MDVGVGSRRGSLLPPVILLVLCYVLAVLISISSIVTEFVVFPRQWIGSVALVVPTMVWFAALLLTGMRGGNRRIMLTLLSILVLFMVPAFVNSILWKGSELRVWVVSGPAIAVPAYTEADLVEVLDAGEPLRERQWIEFAEANLRQGGPVWPSFARYYTDRDWADFTFVEEQSELTLD